MRRTAVALIIFVWVLLAPNAAVAQAKADTKGAGEKQEQKEAAKSNETQTKSGESTETTGGKKYGDSMAVAGGKKTDATVTDGKQGNATEKSGGKNLPGVTLEKTDIYERSLAALTMLFVIAVLLESAFALLFSWRVFLTYFSVTGTKTIVMLAISWVVVYAFDVDILAGLINVYREKPMESMPVSKFITAMILAGGSAAVNKIFVALGFRSIPVPPPDVKPPETKAWVAVLVKQKGSTGRVNVEIKDSGVAAATDPAPIAGTACTTPNLLTLLTRNRNRFPPNGGYEVIPGHVYDISVSGVDSNGQPKTAAVGRFVFANRAIVDFDVTL